jgi:hypothetical protein
MFFYTIMNIFITLLENVNKSRTSAGNLSLSTEARWKMIQNAIYRLHLYNYKFYTLKEMFWEIKYCIRVNCDNLAQVQIGAVW